jgi:glucose-1-phosphate adenylyltransferase
MGFLCHNRAKPSLPVAGGFRVIDFTLSNIINSQISDLVVLVDHQGSSMSDYLTRWYETNGSFESFQVLTPKRGSYTGTANAVYQNLDCLERYTADAVLVLAADHIYKMDYRLMLDFHKRVKAEATVGVVAVPIEQAHRFGIANLEADGRIVDFVEKPKIPQSNLVSMGIYIFNKRVLCERLTEDAKRPNSRHDFGYAIIPSMVRRGKVFAYRFDGYWRDIGDMESYYRSNMELVGPQPALSLDGTWPVLTEQNNSVLSQEFEKGVVENSIVSGGCVVKGHVQNSILSAGVRVEDKALVKNSMLMSNVIVGYHSVVDSCIVDDGVNIGRFCHIGYGTTLMPGDWDVTVVGSGATIPPYTYVGRNCKILPDVGSSDFSTTTVLSGTIVSRRSRIH